MTTLTIQNITRVSSSYLLPGFDAPQTVGDYRVDQDEELIDIFSRLAWRRVGAFGHLPAIGAVGRTHQRVTTDTLDLEAALEKDNQQS